MSRFTMIAVAILGMACLLAGCQPPAPTVAPTPTPATIPTPSFSCTPEAGGDAYECTQAQYDEMVAKDALYAEAEAVFQEFFAENIRISRAGGVEEPTEVLLATATGAFLENAMEIFRDMAKRGLKANGNDPTAAVKRLPGSSKGGSIVALSVCVDASGWAFYRGDELDSHGRPAEDHIYFSRIDGVLKMIGADGGWVDSCSA